MQFSNTPRPETLKSLADVKLTPFWLDDPNKPEPVDALTETVIEPGHVWRNLPGEVHTIEAIEDADVLEVSTAHLEDVVRLHDEYGREGTSAP